MAEFDELFVRVRRVLRPEPIRLELVIPKDAEATARSLAERESRCCTFFTFGFADHGDHLLMRIGVPATQAGVLDAVAAMIHPWPAA